MADAIHEFSSNGSLSYSDIANGHTVATTTGSQTAVVRDIAVTIPGGKAVEFRVDDIAVAKQTGSGAIGGTLLMKASQTLKMYPSDNAYWTGVKTQASAGTSSQFKNSDLLAASDYYIKPKEMATDGRVTMSSRASIYFTGSSTTVLSKTNGGGLSTSNITIYWADEHLGKDEGDFYYTEYIDNAENSNGYNHMKFYDASADTVTEIMDANTNYKNWCGGYSNKYLILRNNSTSFANYKYLDTTTNTVSSDVDLLNSNGSSTNWTISDGKHYFSALDNYCLVKSTTDGSSSDRLGLFRISDGRFNYWDSSTSNNGNAPIRNSGRAYSGFRPALIRNTSGIYYATWPWSHGTGTGDFGLCIYQLGTTEQLDKIVTSGTWGNPDGLNLVTNWKPASGGGNDGFDWRDFVTSDDNTSNKHIGPYNGFRPLKKPTPTDSTSRYWMHCGAASGDGSFVLDMDNVTDGGSDGNNTAGGMAYRVKVKFGTSDTNATFPNYYGEAETWTPTWKPSLLASAYGTMKQRTTGILST